MQKADQNLKSLTDSFSFQQMLSHALQLWRLCAVVMQETMPEHLVFSAVHSLKHVLSILVQWYFIPVTYASCGIYGKQITVERIGILNPQVDTPPFPATVATALQLYQVDPVH